MKADVVIVGGGPAGTATALFLEQRGIQSIIVEKESFPRFHVGESLTGEGSRALRDLGLEAPMMAGNYPVKYATFVHGHNNHHFEIRVKARLSDGQLQDSSTWQVRRSTFDNLLLDTAVERGITLIKGQATKPLYDDNGHIKGIQVRSTHGCLQEIMAKVVVDASGTATFLAKHGCTSQKERGNYTNQVAVFAHVKGAIRDEGPEPDNTHIYYQKLHHWGWFIPIDSEAVSIGVVTPASYLAANAKNKQTFFLRELQQIYEQLAERTKQITLVGAVHTASNFSYHIKAFTGKNFLCVGDAHRFIDPIFSLGASFAFVEAEAAAKAIAAFLDGRTAHLPNPFIDYQIYCERGQDVIQTLIDTFWKHPLAFGYMVHVEFVEEMIDMFAGRVYHEEPTPGVVAMRKLLAM